jgi:HlyD family secretion protein
MTPKPRRRKKKKWILLILLVLAAGGWYGWQATHKPDETIAVQVEKAAKRDITETVVASGRVQPVTQVVISPEVAGEIIELPVKEGQLVKKGDLLVGIKPDNYVAAKNSADASYKAALGARAQVDAELVKAEADFSRTEELFKNKLVAQNVFQDAKTVRDVARLRAENAVHQAEQARFALDRAKDDLAKTTIKTPIDGTITKLKSQLGERVLGTSFNMGTEMMTVAQLDQMEARVDIGEIDIVLVEIGQHVRLEVDAFKDKKFTGTVTAIANATKGSSSALGGGSSSSQDAPKFEVKIRIEDKENFRPGMSVTAEIETRSRKDVLSVPIQSVTTRLPAAPPKPEGEPRKGKPAETVKPQEVVFVLDGDKVKSVPVKTGISDSEHYEIVSGLSEGQEVVSGGYKAISKDLEDGKKVKVGPNAPAPK